MSSNISFNHTLSNISGQIADDAWVSAGYSYLPHVALPAQSGVVIDLVSVGYLPNDVYDYELIMSCWVWTNTTSGNSCTIRIYGGDSTSGHPRVFIVLVNTRVASSQVGGKNCRFPLIGGNKKLFVYNDASVATGTSWGIQITGYRRLGTNT